MKTTILLIGVGLAGVTTSRSIAADAEAGKHLFILSGQSNMREPLIGTFTETVKKTLGTDEVIVSSFAQPSQPIRRWYKSWKPPEGITVKPTDTEVYDRLMAGVQKAIRGQKTKSVTLVWMQGEADAEAGFGGRYEESFFGVLDQLRADLNTKDINFVIGRINDHWLPSHGYVDGDVIRALAVKIGESTPRGAWIDTDDLNTGVNPWGTYEIDGGHFPPAGYRVMGQRFARQACKLADPSTKLDDAFFVETFPADAHKVKANIALGKPISGTQPDAKYSGGKSGLASLVDGKLGAPSHSDPAWLGFLPTEKNIELTIDLGQPTDISAVAVNLLNDHEVAAHYPSQIDFCISGDGNAYRHLQTGRAEVVTFEKKARQRNLANDFKSQATFVVIEKPATGIRFVKVKIVPDTASNSAVFLDEIMVNPIVK